MDHGDYAGRGLYRQRQTREPAAAHFRRMGQAASPLPENEDEREEPVSARFEIYRGEQATITSARDAIAILQGQAGAAVLPDNH